MASRAPETAAQSRKRDGAAQAEAEAGGQPAGYVFDTIVYLSIDRRGHLGVPHLVNGTKTLCGRELGEVPGPNAVRPSYRVFEREGCVRCKEAAEAERLARKPEFLPFLYTAAPDYYTACDGGMGQGADHDARVDAEGISEGVSPLTWLSGLVSGTEVILQMEEAGENLIGLTPSELADFRTAVAESRKLLDALRAATVKARGHASVTGTGKEAGDA